MPDTNLFVVLYSGKTVNEARVIAASTNPELVRHAAEVMLNNERQEIGLDRPTEARRQGRVAALTFATERPDEETLRKPHADTLPRTSTLDHIRRNSSCWVRQRQSCCVDWRGYKRLNKEAGDRPGQSKSPPLSEGRTNAYDKTRGTGLDEAQLQSTLCSRDCQAPLSPRRENLIVEDIDTAHAGHHAAEKQLRPPRSPRHPRPLGPPSAHPESAPQPHQPIARGRMKKPAYSAGNTGGSRAAASPSLPLSYHRIPVRDLRALPVRINPRLQVLDYRQTCAPEMAGRPERTVMVRPASRAFS